MPGAYVHSSFFSIALPFLPRFLNRTHSFLISSFVFPLTLTFGFRDQVHRL